MSWMKFKMELFDIWEWLTIVLQAIRVLRNGDYAPYIVFIAAPTIATMQEVFCLPAAPLSVVCVFSTV